MKAIKNFWEQDRVDATIRILKDEYPNDEIYDGSLLVPHIMRGDSILVIDNLIVDGEVPIAVRYQFDSQHAVDSADRIVGDSSCWQIASNAVQKYINLLASNDLKQRMLIQMRQDFMMEIVVSPEFEFTPTNIQFHTSYSGPLAVTVIVPTIRVTTNKNLMMNS